jgi:hypothetical protein
VKENLTAEIGQLLSMKETLIKDVKTLKKLKEDVKKEIGTPVFETSNGSFKALIPMRIVERPNGTKEAIYFDLDPKTKALGFRFLVRERE